jgi:glycosyltransferase involved in cell wall biosynthesis
VHILVDYRAALRERTGVGHYAHELVRALVASSPPDQILSVFSSSWTDRLDPARVPGARVIDRRVPVRVLNSLWHRWEWPPIELLAGTRVDIAHSLHPLLMPARRAAQVVTIHDLDFLDHPERSGAEIRRDYPALAAAHATRADRVIVISQHTAGEVERRLGVPASRISVCVPGAPEWPRRAHEPVPGSVLFVGTLDARKNVGALIDAYARVVAARPDAPPLVLAGRKTPDADVWLPRIDERPLAGHVRMAGYVPHAELLALYNDAILLVMPSHHEGFGIPALEAMTTGVPVVAADRGALPEVIGDAGLLVDPMDAEAFAATILRALADRSLRDTLRERGWRRAAGRQWADTASAARDAYALALDARRQRG